MALRNHLVPELGRKRLDEIGPEDVETYKSTKLKTGQSRKSINNHLAVLGKMLHLAAEWGVIRHAPKIRLFRIEATPFRFLDFDETPRFLAAVPDEWRTFALVALKTGLRVGEMSR